MPNKFICGFIVSSILCISAYPQDMSNERLEVRKFLACLDKIDELYSRLIISLGYKKPDKDNSAPINDNSAGLSDDKISPGINGSGKTYMVKYGDYLRKLAASFYGNERYWWLIYDHNRNLGLFGADPDLIYPGVTIEIPELPER